jgi:large subunit ribosomal protein L25
MKIEKRTESLNAVRKMNKVPGVLFGKSITPVSIQVDAMELQEAFRDNGLTQTFNVKLGRESYSVYIKNIQRDILNRNHFLNVELLKIDKGDRISAKIPLHILGRDVVEHKGYIVQVVCDDIDVEYEAGKGVSRIDVDITNLKVKDMIHVRDVVFPEGIHVLDEPDKMLIHITEQRIVEVEPEAAPASTEQQPVEEPAPKEDAKH